MKKLSIIFFAFILISILVFTSCGGAEETTTTSKPPTTQPTTSQPTTSQPTTSQPTTAQPTTPAITKGGILRCVANAIPKNLGYGPEKAPSDNYYMLPVIERLCDWDEQGNIIPMLAKSWDVDDQALTITWHLQPNVKFHDGTDWNAEALRWNYQISIDNARLTDAKYIDSLEVKDELTLVMHLNAFNWTMLENWGLLMQAISPTSFETAGGTIPAGSDIEKSKEWARANAVGTGPFTVSDFQRDVVIKFAKNPNYWQPGMPYLDAIELWYIPDAMVAAAKIEAGEADMWFAVSTVQNIIDLQEKGFQIVWGPGMFVMLLPDSNNPDSPLYIKEVREAIEYAIDRPAIAEMLGQGLFEPLHQMASSKWPGYVQGYDPRPFDPAKARELLDQAGLSAGFSIKIMATSAGTDAVAALQSYLGDVGITVEPDIADLGRYFGSVFATGYTDLVFSAAGINPSCTDLYTHYGPNPVTFRTGNMWKSDQYIAFCNAGLDPQYKTVAEAMSKIKDAIRQAGEDAMLVPLWRTAECSISQSYVHTDYPKIHGIIWTPVDDWMDAH